MRRVVRVVGGGAELQQRCGIISIAPDDRAADAGGAHLGDDVGDLVGAGGDVEDVGQGAETHELLELRRHVESAVVSVVLRLQDDGAAQLRERLA